MDPRMVIKRLKSHLIEKGVVNEFPENENDVIEVLLKHYVKYPMPESAFPYNYCLADKLLGNWIKPIINVIC